MLYKHYRKEAELTTLISDKVEFRTIKIIKKNGALHMILKVSFLRRHDNPNSKLNWRVSKYRRQKQIELKQIMEKLSQHSSLSNLTEQVDKIGKSIKDLDSTINKLDLIDIYIRIPYPREEHTFLFRCTWYIH